MSRYYQTSRNQPIDYGFELPYEAMAKALDSKTQQQDFALNAVGQLGQVGQVLEADKANLMKYKQYLDQNTDKLSRTDLTSAQGRREYMDFSRKVRDAVGPGGAVNQMYNNYAKAQDWIKRINEDKDMDRSRRDILINSVMSNYKGVTDEMNEFQGGQYRSFQDYTPAKYVDMPKRIDESVKGIMADSFSVEKDKNTGRLIYRDKTSKKEVSFNEAYSIARDMALNDQELMNYYTEGVQLGMIDRDIPLIANVSDGKGGFRKDLNPNSTIGQLVNASARKYSFVETEESRTERYDDLYLHGAKKKIDDYIPPVEFTGVSSEIAPAADVTKITESANSLQTAINQEGNRITKVMPNGKLPVPAGFNFNKLNTMSSAQIGKAIELYKNDTKNAQHYGKLVNLLEDYKFKASRVEELRNNAFNGSGQQEGTNLAAQAFNNIQNQDAKYFVINNRSQFVVQKADGTYVAKKNIVQQMDKFIPGYSKNIKNIKEWNSMLNEYVKGLNSVMKNPEPNKINIPATQSTVLSVYDANGIVNPEQSQAYTKSIQNAIQEGAFANATVYDASNMDKALETNEVNTVMNVIKNSSMETGKTAVAFDKIPRSDGKKYAEFGVGGKRYTIPLESFIVDNRKASDASRGPGASVDGFTIRLAQEGVSKWDMNLNGKTYSVWFDKTTIPQDPNSDVFFNDATFSISEPGNPRNVVWSGSDAINILKLNSSNLPQPK